jgi:hypothetical protein
MTERFAVSRSGLPTVFLGPLAIHSNYDPEKEARRYINSLGLKKGGRIFIFIEPGLGYAVRELRRRVPRGLMLALHCSAAFADRTGADAEWHPQCGTGLADFLAAHIDDDDAPFVQLVEWKPSMNAYGSLYSGLVSCCAVFLKRSAANARTAAYFEKKWKKNTERNLRFQKKVLGFTPGNCPVLITGSGPGLEPVLPLIRDVAEKKTAFILAASSSVPALLSAGIEPSLMLSSDGGNWAKYHLLDALRLWGSCRSAGSGPLLAASVSAALPSQYAALPLLLVGHEPGPAQGGTIPRLILPQRGTVTALALDLALVLSSGPLYFAGMDLQNDDIKSHARPYALDYYVNAGTSRLDPPYSRFYKRMEKAGALTVLEIYASWFREQLPRIKRPCYFLGSRPFLLDGFLPHRDSVKKEGALMPVFSVYEVPGGSR